MSKKSELLGTDLPLKLTGQDRRAPPSKRHDQSIALTADQLFSLRRIQALARGDAAKHLTPHCEAVLHGFAVSVDPGTGDDLFLWLRNNNLPTGYSTVRAAITVLAAKGLIEPAELPSHAVRPGPRTGYFRITEKGRRALHANSVVLRILEDA